ncbi:HTH-type transcriptional activator Btr [Caulifigura coniformis]|uniref:HTH-type transcriptional activator Btr n=1 Tax=Caulifigura coniformis TaxID=2527983 RepID=A0A517SMU9_9PLAN|nr:AraC family transcriptional regulator [Caulifigura coniformis]QDT57448.1 HTH-type transcriptional activator Btr [Caulifigura coniformis]
MSQADVVAPSARPTLTALLSCWPVVCQVDGERSLSAPEDSLESPALAVVTAGPLWVRFANAEPERLESGDLIVTHETDSADILSHVADDLSASNGFWRPDDLSSSPGLLVVRLECIGTQFAPGLMPRPFVIRSPGSADRALSSSLLEIVRLGVAAPVANAAATALYLHVIQQHLQAKPRDVQMLAGLFDSEIGPVVAALLQSPAQDWTVESLADVGDMSRSAFARKFRDLMGAAPIDFLVEVRMWLAARLLKQPSRDLKSIAREAGYQSPAAFSVAFKRWSGETPSDYRRRG